MEFVEVKELPRMGYRRNELKARLDEFMRMRVKTVEVKWEGTYGTASYAQMNISRAVTREALPIDVRRKGDNVYLIRRDM
jgi:hypothetical protein